ncbi:serine hydrolase domain-containing protein [Microbacterium sp. NPDC090225]|uniref:serine hydrolase domain-containing protein n=1 Tax=Microbacterium sp. NPDC090225 TaxID=3364207 RepID=UPI003825B21A
MNGAPGSAWASLRSIDGVEERLVLGTASDEERMPVTPAHLFDLASLTKTFTTVAALRLVDAGLLGLDEPVRPLLAVGAGDGAERITLRHLLTHTSGLPAEGGAWRSGLAGDELRARVIGSDLLAAPGTAHRYSDVGFIAVGALIEHVARRPLDAVIAEVAALLGASSLTWRPEPSLAVATEVQPHRGLVQGEVHDELAHALGRPAGHAGLFGTADDVASLARMIRDDGAGAEGRALSADGIRLMTTPVATADAGYGQALGLRVHDAAWMGRADAVGHTGFTGTAFAVSPRTGDFGVLLTNRVHPTREGTDVSAVRREFFSFLG